MVSKQRLLQLEVLKGTIDDLCPKAVAAMYKGIIKDHFVLLHVAEALLQCSEEYDGLKRKPIEGANPYEVMIGARWSALRQLVEKDPE